jgi:hypothetical protein
MTSDEPPRALWTPNGQRRLNGDVTRVELSAAVGEWLRQFWDVAQALGLGLHCASCQGDLVGKNAETDPVYGVSCNCRDFIWKNRDFRGPTFPGE